MPVAQGGGPATSAPVAPSPQDRERWRLADAAARPARLDQLRARLAAEGLDAYLGIAADDARYLTGFELGDGEEKVCGSSGRFAISADEVVVLADSRYRLQAAEQCPGARIVDVSTEMAALWPDLVAGLAPIRGRRDASARFRVGVDADHLDHATWLRLAEATPDVELVPVAGIVRELRAVKEPLELERIRAACRVADRALEETLADIRPGVTEHELALALEWRMRTGGADALAFDVACLAGERAALPHGSPGARTIRHGEVLLFDFGAQVAGYRSDMTRTLFVGQPTPRDLEVYALVAEAQAAALACLRDALATGAPITNRKVDAAARGVIEAAGRGAHFGHGTGHGIGLATHELPSVGRAAPERPLPSPTVFSIEPGVYLDHVTGVRIEDLVSYDAGAARLEVLTGFDRGVTVVGA